MAWRHDCLLGDRDELYSVADNKLGGHPAGSPSTARIWIYRNDAPNEPNQTPYVRLNGQKAGVVQPSGAFYRDVPPGYYTVAVNSYGAPYPHQFADFNLGAGQEAFVEVLSMREKVGTAEGLRTLFFHSSSRLTSLAPPSLGRPFTAAARCQRALPAGPTGCAARQ